MSLRRQLLPLAFAVAALVVAALAFAFATFASVAIPIFSLSVADSVGVVVDAKCLTSAVGRIR